VSGGDLILGIESSCDDTAVAVVDAAGRVLSSVVASQAAVHSQFGGVYPEFASRAHISSIIPAVKQALSGAGIGKDALRAIAATRGPGLIGPLLVGLSTASGLGVAWDLPVIGVNHLRGHLRSADLEQRRVEYPAIVLLVSGGHTFLAYMTSASDLTLMGSTRDDSVGEAYDKVGRMLGLGYPAGAKIDKLALSGSATIAFPRPMLAEGLEFSFSGLKSAVSKYMAQQDVAAHEDVAASFVEACMEVLLTKCRRALLLRPAKSLVVVGGVSASPQLRAGAKALCDELGVGLCLPPLKWATDNAAMVALAAWDYLSLGKRPAPMPNPRLAFTEF
jgi:N6-L-threonylcarbamoyladenine synthase